jgi:galactoside O-acetyltransferase
MTFWSSIFRWPRIIKYRLLSDNRKVTGHAQFNQPVLLLGKGSIRFGQNVQLGFFPSPFFYSGYIHLESREPDSFIEIGDNVMINNNFYAISAGPGITIGADTLIGLNCEIIDSDFHEITPDKRRQGNPATEKVVLGRNVFLGNNVKITKGVVLGNNVVVGNGSLVNTSFEDNVIIGGVPAKVIGRI